MEFKFRTKLKDYQDIDFYGFTKMIDKHHDYHNDIDKTDNKIQASSFNETLFVCVRNKNTCFEKTPIYFDIKT